MVAGRAAKVLPVERINDIVIQLPKQWPDTVIVLALKNDLHTDTVRYVSSNIGTARFNVLVKYVTGEGDGGSYRLEEDGQYGEENR